MTIAPPPKLDHVNLSHRVEQVTLVSWLSRTKHITDVGEKDTDDLLRLVLLNLLAMGDGSAVARNFIADLWDVWLFANAEGILSYETRM